MVNFQLLNLILYNFSNKHMNWLMILHCWNWSTQLHFANMSQNNDFRIELWPMNQIKLEGDLEGRILRHENPHEAIFFDMNCKNSLNILQKVPSLSANKEKLFKHHFHWLIYDSKADLQSVIRLFANVHMAVDADVTVAMPSNTHNSSYILYDMYNNGLSLGGKLNVTGDRELTCSRKECVLKRYLSSLHERLKYGHRWFLRDITMRVATVVTSLPLTAPEDNILAHLSSIKDKHIDGVARFGFQYITILKENLECRFRYNFSSRWARTEISGGVIGAVGVDDTSDLASSPFLVSASRLKYSQPTLETGSFRQVCIFRTPQNAEIKSKVFLEPFSVKVWVIFVAILLLIAFLLWLTFLAEFHKMKTSLVFKPSFLSMCLVSFGSACCQGSFLIPTSGGGRIAFITLSLLTFIIYNYYTSIVVSILLGSPVKSNIKTMAQLADSNLEVGLLPIAYTKTYLNVSPLPEIRKFVHNKIESKRNPSSVWLNVDDGLRRVRDDPGFVFVIESFSGFDVVERMYTAKEICDLNEIPLRPEQPLYQHLHKNSSYREIIQLKQIRILESGVHRRHERLWVKRRLNCHLSSSFLVQVGWEYTAPLFIMLAAIYVFVLFLMTLEMLWKKFENKLRLMQSNRVAAD